jgi:hypothetical protein
MQQLDLQQWKQSVSSWSLPRCYKQMAKLVEFCTEGSEKRTWARETEESTLLEAVCQGTANEDTEGWERLSGFCGNLWIVEISGGTVITYTYQSCV